MKKQIQEDFTRLDLFHKSKEYIKENIMNDEVYLKEIFQIDYITEQFEEVFEVATYGADICQTREDSLRYKITYDVKINGESLVMHLYIFFDKDGNIIDDFFD